MKFDASAMGHALLRRAILDSPDAPDSPVPSKFPSWAPFVALADLIVFLPVILIVGYTLGSIIPTLAIVEDPNPPAYEPVALDDGAADQGPAAPLPGKPVTSSLRATRRLLSSVAGWRSYFRGIVCAAVLSIALGSVNITIQKFLPLIPVGSLLARLLLPHVSAAWTHIVISGSSKRRFYQRLPPFKKTFEATCFPILAVWLAETGSSLAVIFLSKALGLPIPEDGPGGKQPEPRDVAPWKLVIIFLVALLSQVVFVIPANVLLVRVQASLLPEEEETIVPFDRSFQGKVEPAIVGGKGFVSMRDALATFPLASWLRLYKLYAKIIAVSIAAYGLMFAAVIPQMIAIHKARKA